MKKLGIILAALFAVVLVAGCSSSKPSTAPAASSKMAHHDMKGETDYKGELRMK
jgi:PBP1b-binding outer membrane lipoprotein LpoB